MGKTMYDGTYAPSKAEKKRMDRDAAVQEMLDSGNWKWGVVQGCPTKYLVSKEGKIVNGTTLQECRGSISASGYRESTFYCTDENGRAFTITTGQHRMVAETWIPNPENKQQVDHIDRDRLHNSVDNLRWVSAAENTMNRKIEVTSTKNITYEMLQHVMRLIIYDDAMTYDDVQEVCDCSDYFARKIFDLTKYLQQEGLIMDDGKVDWKWKPLVFNNFTTDRLVSPYGLIATEELSIMQGEMIPNGSIRVGIMMPIKGQLFAQNKVPIARAVAKAFIENPDNKPIVTHIDGNMVHDWVGNLKWATGSEVSNVSKGEENGNSRFTEEQIIQACELMMIPLLPATIEERTGVSRITQRRIQEGKTWREIGSRYKFPVGRFDGAGRFIREDGSVFEGSFDRNHRGSPKKYTNDDVKRVWALLDDPKNNAEGISKKTGIPVGTVYKIRRLWVLNRKLAAKGIKI